MFSFLVPVQSIADPSACASGLPYGFVHTELGHKHMLSGNEPLKNESQATFKDACRLGRSDWREQQSGQKDHLMPQWSSPCLMQQHCASPCHGHTVLHRTRCRNAASFIDDYYCSCMTSRRVHHVTLTWSHSLHFSPISIPSRLPDNLKRQASWIAISWAALTLEPDWHHIRPLLCDMISDPLYFVAASPLLAREC